MLIRAEKRVQSYSAIINILQSTEKPINGHLCTIENRSGIISESYVSFSYKIDKFWTAAQIITIEMASNFAAPKIKSSSSVFEFGKNYNLFVAKNFVCMW